MATHKLLSSGQLALDTPASIGGPPSLKRWMVKTIVLHNVRAGDSVAEIFFDGAVAANKLLKVTLEQDETFEWAVGHMLVLLESGSEVLQGNADYTTAVTYHIFGAEETE